MYHPVTSLARGNDQTPFAERIWRQNISVCHSFCTSIFELQMDGERVPSISFQWEKGRECKHLSVATKWHLKATTVSDIQQPGGVQRLVACRRVCPRDQPTWMINKAAVTERTLIPLTLSGLLVSRRDAAVTATVAGGASDLCLTNGCFIIPSEPCVYCSLF